MPILRHCPNVTLSFCSESLAEPTLLACLGQTSPQKAQNSEDCPIVLLRKITQNLVKRAPKTAQTPQNLVKTTTLVCIDVRVTQVRSFAQPGTRWSSKYAGTRLEESDIESGEEVEGPGLGKGVEGGCCKRSTGVASVFVRSTQPGVKAAAGCSSDLTTLACCEPRDDISSMQ